MASKVGINQIYEITHILPPDGGWQVDIIFNIVTPQYKEQVLT